MKKMQLLILFISLLFGSVKIIASEFPPYEDVLNKFFNSYDLRQGQNIYQIDFMKMPGGYFLIEKDNNYQAIDTLLFWSEETEKYEILDFPDAKNNHQDLIDAFSQDFDARYFDLFPYYNYYGWEDDVIELYGSSKLFNIKNLYKRFKTKDESELYALARAYSSKAMNYLNNNSALSDPATRFQLPETGKKLLNNDQLEKFREAQNNAISYFRKLCGINPDYQTIVGDICNKYHNEYMAAFLNMMIYQDFTEAKKYLADSLYETYLRDYACNVLSSCDKNAILFTHGDNDTYPLLYMQKKYGFRDDVCVINYSLLSNNNYMNHFRTPGCCNTPVKTILTPETHKESNLEIIGINKTGKSGHSLMDAISLIEDKDASTRIEGYPYYRHLNSNSFSINDDIIFEIEKSYIYRNDIFLLDIVASNFPDRPVFFTSTINLFFVDYLRSVGIVYRLGNQPCEGINKSVPCLNPGKTYDLLINKYKYTLDNKPNDYEISYKVVFNQLTLDLAKRYKKDSCKTVIDKYLKLFTPDRRKYDIYMLPMLEAAYLIKDTKTGRYIAGQILDYVEYSFKEWEEGIETRFNKNILLYALAKINEISNNDLKDRITDLEEKYAF